jgi:hypothetical protein
MGECITKPKIKSFLLYVSSSIENTSGLQNELSILYVDNKPCPANSPNSVDCPSLFFFFFSGGTEVLSEHLKKAITVAIGVFQACWG